MHVNLYQTTYAFIDKQEKQNNMNRTILKTAVFAIALLLLTPAVAFTTKKRITVFTIGDSTMADKDTIDNPERGWAQALPLFFHSGDVTVENHARNGRSTKSFIDEGRWDAVAKKLKKGDYVFIQFGHNDEKQERANLYADPHGAYKANLTRFVKETRAKGASPVLMTSIVRRKFDDNGMLLYTHGEYPDAVRELANELKVPLVDMEAKTRHKVQQLGTERSKEMFVWFDAGVYAQFPDGKKDDTHLNEYGARTVAQLAVEGIRELKLPLAEYLKPVPSAYLFETGRTASVYMDKAEKTSVHTAVALLQKDVRNVFDADLQISEDRNAVQIVAGTIGVNKEIARLAESGKIDLSEITGKWEAFRIATVTDGGREILVIAGSDSRGTAYGLLELSRMIGVSPWHYFADSKPAETAAFSFPETPRQDRPSVRYRGIFLNDEDWGLMPWATQTLAPHSEKGAIGPEAYEKIFELLLRLRANTIWPAMHECTVPFYFVKGNREMADRYGIVVGTSHCEPLMRCSAGEWDIAGQGDYNYVTNKDAIIGYWAERLKELNGSDNVYTIGMRGKHDGMMQGVRTLDEHKFYLSQIIRDQQELIRRFVNPEPSQAPQIFIPYKEVLDVYDAGLEVPEHVTLVWCDDNYGYIRRLSDARERLRAGSSGVYYHVSYWGRPHDYLWLASTSPALVYTEMMRAYEHGADRLWILNAGDIKPAEYLTEFFLDMAWNIRFREENGGEQSVFSHLNRWAEREFGKPQATAVTEIMKTYYRLANIRKPEFMGWSRVEESGFPRGLTPIEDSEYNPDFDSELQRRLQSYLLLEEQVAKLKPSIPAHKVSAFYQLVEYPVRGASLMNQKWLYAQLSHHHTHKDMEQAKEYAEKSRQAYRKTEQITAGYQTMENGKWNRIMDFRPRKLPVFDEPAFPMLDSLINAGYQPKGTTPQNDKKITGRQGFVLAQNACQAIDRQDAGKVIEGLGHSFSAVQMKQGRALTFTFDIPRPGEAWIKIATVPNHDVDMKGMKIMLSVDGKEIGEFDYSVSGRSETWKQNVLRGQAVSTARYRFPQAGKVNITVKALTPYIIVDQIMTGQGEDDFYEFPVNGN
jgi:lysophospholipase L1-like esterase